MQKPPGLRLDLLGQIGSFSARAFEKPIQNFVADLVSYRKEAVMKLNNNFSFSCFSLFFFSELGHRRWEYEITTHLCYVMLCYVMLYHISMKEIVPPSIPDLRKSSNGFRI